MPRVDNRLFLAELGKLYECKRNLGTGSVWISMKSCDLALMKGMPKKRRKALKLENNGEENICLVRATDGKTSVSTEVSEVDAEHFSNLLNSVIRLNLDNLSRMPQTEGSRRKENKLKNRNSKDETIVVEGKVDKASKSAKVTRIVKSQKSNMK